ncbi:MAG: TonB-dependent receptor, partial [Bacteroidota bacterium]
MRSLQIIDGVDNQSPGLNFSLGNFLGASDLDVLKVDLVVGASSAFFGPNAFNGVIDMRTKNPFLQKGLSASVKVGERNMLKTAVRYADVIKNKSGEDKFAYKINLMYLTADDWEANNFNPTDQSRRDADNPGGYDAVNVYGDENLDNGRNFDLPDSTAYANFPGLGEFYRRGYEERDLVDYGTENIKASAALHYKLTQDIELIGSYSFGSGTTVYQGDNRFSLKDIKFYQSRIEIMKPNKFFLRAYQTGEDAGNSYDAYFTALLLQEEFKSNSQWSSDYIAIWRNNGSNRVRQLEGYPQGFPINFPQLVNVINSNQDSISKWHQQVQDLTNSPTVFNPNSFLEPGTPEFQEAFDRITSNLPTDEERGTRFFDRSKLFHVHGEYKFTPKFMDITLGANYRKYSPDSKGTIFSDTADVKITNSEFGVYTGIEKKFIDQKLKVNATLRMDKNENFDLLFSPAVSAVYSPDKKNIFRVSFSSAIRNPTLADQYLNFDVGRATLLGNLNGVNNVVTLESV